MDNPQYQSRVSRKTLSGSQPELEPVNSVETKNNRPADLFDRASNSSLLWTLLVLALATVTVFAIADAVLFVIEVAQSSLISAGLLAALLFALTLTIVVFIYREWSSYFLLKRLYHLEYSLEDLQAKDNRELTLKDLKRRKKLHASSAFMQSLYSEFFNTVKAHHSNTEILDIYQKIVIEPAKTYSRQVLKKESYSAGGVAFVSPNSLIQSLGLLWMSMRTLKKIALIYGIRPGFSSNLKLLRIAMENLAASSLIDVLTDEFANQIGASIGERVVEKTTDAIAVGALNQRLGKALIAEFNSALFK